LSIANLKKTIAYVDGYNIYRGLMDKTCKVPNADPEYLLRKYLWLNLESYIKSYIEYKGYGLVQTFHLMILGLID
jgi:hypothetical protein